MPSRAAPCCCSMVSKWCASTPTGACSDASTGACDSTAMLTPLNRAVPDPFTGLVLALDDVHPALVAQGVLVRPFGHDGHPLEVVRRRRRGDLPLQPRRVPRVVARLLAVEQRQDQVAERQQVADAEHAG